MSEAEYCFHSLHFVPEAEEINTHYEHFLANLANLSCFVNYFYLVRTGKLNLRRKPGS